MALFQLVYISKSSESFDTKELSTILGTAKQENSHKEITGNLLYDGGRFIQILEGEEDDIKRLFDKISLDKRHTNVKLLYFQEASSRLFPRWSMNVVNLKVDKPKNLSEIKTILEEVEEEQDVGQSPVALKLFTAFKEAG